MEAGHIGHARHGGDVARHHGEEAVQAHARGQGKGLVGQEGHAEHADGGGDAGGHEHAIPKGRTDVEICQQVGVQGNDVGHCHERGESRQKLRAHVGAVFPEVEQVFHRIPSFLF